MARLEIYAPGRWGNHPVKERNCRQRMFQRFSAYQCSRPAVVQEEGYGWCKQHSPSAVKAREDARSARYADISRRSRYAEKGTRLRNAVVEAALNWDVTGKGDGPLLDAVLALKTHLAEKP